MIDYIDEVEACVKSDISDGRENDIYGYTSVGRMGEIITRLRQAEKDAARYRFIKQWNQSYSLNVYREGLWDEIIDSEISNESRRIMKSSNGGDL